MSNKTEATHHDGTEEESNLVKHARRELRLLGYTGKEHPDDPNRWMHDGIMEVVGAFDKGGHSGSSAAYAIGIIERVLQFQNITPLTNDPAEWINVGDGMWQSTRRSDAFSTNGGQSYYCLDEDRVNGERIMHVSEVAK